MVGDNSRRSCRATSWAAQPGKSNWCCQRAQNSRLRQIQLDYRFDDPQHRSSGI
jgi:hypothetical protein